MKKTTLVSSLVLAGLVVNFVIPTALAAHVNVPGVYPHKADSEAVVKFEKPDTNPPEVITPPVKPPVGPTDPEPPHVGTDDALSLSVPSVLNFGTHKLEANEMKLNPTLVHHVAQKLDEDGNPLEFDLPNMFVVRDLRGIDGSSWGLSASLTEFKNGNKTLKGATVSFLKGAQAYNSGLTDLLIPEANDKFMIPRAGFTFNTAPQTIMTAKEDAGRGDTTFVADSRYSVDALAEKTYEGETQDNGIELLIPASAGKEVNEGYKATFEWTISDTADLITLP